MWSLIWPWSFFVLAGSSYVSPSSSADVKINLFTPRGSLPLSPTLVSFSLEQDRWPDWTGLASQNRFVYNALTNLAKNTGRPPKIRVGAHSEDKTRWNASVDVIEAIFPRHTARSPYPEATNITVSDEYYKLSKWMPKGTYMTWGLNFGYDDIQNAVNIAESIMRAFNNKNQVDDTGVFLERLELGNEPDLFAGSIRPTNWTVQAYISDWENVMTAVARAVKLSPHGPVTVQGCSFAGQKFTPRETFADGLLEREPGKLISAIAQHRFSIGGPFLMSSFMSKAAVRSNISILSDDIVATRAKGLMYVLGGPGGMSNTAGAALWTIDYAFQAATRGISEIYFHHGIGSNYGFFIPIALDRSPINDTPLDPPLPPHAQSDYYAGIIITEGIGIRAASGETKISEIDLNEVNISGYAIYEYGLLARAVFINLNAWLVADEGIRERKTTHIDLQLLLSDGVSAMPVASDNVQTANGVGEISVRRLKIGHADDTKNLTWNGQSYETPDILVSGQPDEEKVWFWEGFDIAETEAVMILFRV